MRRREREALGWVRQAVEEAWRRFAAEEWGAGMDALRRARKGLRELPAPAAPASMPPLDSECAAVEETYRDDDAEDDCREEVP